MKRAVSLIAFSVLLTGCASLGEELEKIIVPKVVEAPQHPGPDECLEYHADFPQMKLPEGSEVLPPSAFLKNWNNAKKKYRALNGDHSVCRAWHQKRRIQLGKEPKKVAGKPNI